MRLPAEARVTYGPHPEHFTSPFVPKRDISLVDLKAMQHRTTAAVEHRQWSIAAELGTALAFLSRDFVREFTQDKTKRPFVERLVAERRPKSERYPFYALDTREYRKILVARKLLFPRAPELPFDEELFATINSGLAEVDSIGKASLTWRRRLEEARDLAILYPEQRSELAVDKVFFDVVVFALSQAQERGDGEDAAKIAASKRILYPKRFSLDEIGNPQDWVEMKTVHARLSQLGQQAAQEGVLPYEYWVRLAQHDANMAIIAAREIKITPKEVKITPIR